MSILILVTGGTFDKEYDEKKGRLYFLGTHVPEMLERARSLVPARVKTLMMKDSLHMTPADRRKVLAACRAAREKRIVVTHGTDTMVETARLLGAELSDSGKTVVLTGAMVPYAFGSSDGLFNLGAALAYAQAMPPGVWVAMNGRAHPYNRVRKNRRLARFLPT
ncbi:MAG: L-asparaginase [Elusimicrobia bacterium]|nr:MAG: L-asparaginase [Elusimicrobiota bacterium]